VASLAVAAKAADSEHSAAAAASAVEADDDDDPVVPVEGKTSAVEDCPPFADSPSRCYDCLGFDTAVAKALDTVVGATQTAA